MIAARLIPAALAVVAAVAVVDRERHRARARRAERRLEHRTRLMGEMLLGEFGDATLWRGEPA